MTFSAVWQFVPGDEGGLNRFLLEHYLEHKQFIDSLSSLAEPFIALDLPIQRMEDPKYWLAAHQEMSQSAWTGIGGGQSTDFGTLDWESESAVHDWQNLHELWHQQVRNSLGL